MTPADLMRAALRAWERQDLATAVALIAEAAARAPGHAGIAVTHANLAYETWAPAVALFERALSLAPDHSEIVRGHATALAAEGDPAVAHSVLAERLRRVPDWLDGHRALARLLATIGEPADASFAAAVAARPGDARLRLAWFHQCVLARDWTRARQVVDDAVDALGDLRPLKVARAYLASESPAASCDPALFDAVAEVVDPGLDLARVRFWLRVGDPARAAAIAEARLGTPDARGFWPYLSLAWRLLDDPRAAWLDGTGGYVATCDLGFGVADRAALAATLRALLAPCGAFLDQSVRGGVQTDRHLFFHPALQPLRARVVAAVAGYVASLPPPDPRHPLLGPARNDLRFAGSWAVLLGPGGSHAPHTHKFGWISSALHVDLPDASAPLRLGVPPPELGLDLPAQQVIAPRPGQLVLFSSTTWHDTVPFAHGDRLTVAFDMRIAA